IIIILQINLLYIYKSYIIENKIKQEDFPLTLFLFDQCFHMVFRAVYIISQCFNFVSYSQFIDVKDFIFSFIGFIHLDIQKSVICFLRRQLSRSWCINYDIVSVAVFSFYLNDVIDLFYLVIFLHIID